MKANKFFRFIKVLSYILFAGVVLTLAACDSGTTETATTTETTLTTGMTTGVDITTTEPVTTTETTTEEPIDLDATLTDLTVNGLTILGFNPLKNDYTLVLSSDITTTPSVVAVKYESTSTVDITNAVNIESLVEADRTTTVTVTTGDGITINIYTILFETAIETVLLGTADDFVILGESAISTSTSSIITGDIGLSPAAATYITGFSLIIDSTNTFATSTQIVGNVYASDYTSPTPSMLTTAVADMQIAYVDAAGRAANYNELYSGDLSGKTLTTGVYKWGNSVLINTDLTLNGSATDIFIFQIAGI